MSMLPYPGSWPGRFLKPDHNLGPCAQLYCPQLARLTCHSKSQFMTEDSAKTANTATVSPGWSQMFSFAVQYHVYL